MEYIVSKIKELKKIHNIKEQECYIDFQIEIYNIYKRVKKSLNKDKDVEI